MKRVEVKKAEKILTVSVEKVSETKIYAGRRKDSYGFALITANGYRSDRYKAMAIHDGFTYGNSYNTVNGLGECMKGNGSIEWNEFDTFREFCEWYIEETK